MQITMTDVTENAEVKIAEYAAICYDADTSPDRNEKRVKSLMKQRHLATLRFASATFLVEGISRACSHQLVRHPHLSYLQRSQRYTLSAGLKKDRLQFSPSDGPSHHPLSRFSLLDEEWAAEQYANGYTMNEIAIAMNSDSGSVCRMLHRSGADIRQEAAIFKGTEACYFDGHISAEAAQILGFLCADGNLCGNQISIEQAEENYTYLMAIRNVLRPSGPVLSCKKSDHQDVQDTYKLYITSERMAERLTSLGLTESKGLTFNPELILAEIDPVNHKWFWRGMIDGDGTISHPKISNDPHIGLAGTKATCEAFLEFCRNCGVQTSATLIPIGNSFKVIIGGRRQVKTLLGVFYGEPSVLVFPKKSFRAGCIDETLMAPYVQSAKMLAALADTVIPQSIVTTLPAVSSYFIAVDTLNGVYKGAIKAGIRKEDARFVLPQAVHTEMYVTGNFQAWFDFLLRRLDKHAQWEIRLVASMIYGYLRQTAPNIFNADTLGFSDEEIYGPA